MQDHLVQRSCSISQDLARAVPTEAKNEAVNGVTINHYKPDMLELVILTVLVPVQACKNKLAHTFRWRASVCDATTLSTKCSMAQVLHKTYETGVA